MAPGAKPKRNLKAGAGNGVDADAAQPDAGATGGQAGGGSDAPSRTPRPGARPKKRKR
ncbi:hypothetical protein MAHJHV35_17920 [Mycobacterium avium subsp. hominissuis]